MKSLLTGFLIVSFFSIAVFGLLAMNHGEGEGHTGCIGAVSQGTSCPEENEFTSALFHVSAFKNFSSAVFEGFSLALLTLILLFINFLWSFLQARTPEVRPHSFRLADVWHSRAERKVRHWLSLHENSPGVAYAPI